MANMIEAKLRIDRFGFNVANTGVPAFASDEKRLSDNQTILVNDITIAMQKLEYASYRGKVYTCTSKRAVIKVHVHLFVYTVNVRREHLLTVRPPMSSSSHD